MALPASSACACRGEPSSSTHSTGPRRRLHAHRGSRSRRRCRNRPGRCSPYRSRAAHATSSGYLPGGSRCGCRRRFRLCCAGTQASIRVAARAAVSTRADAAPRVAEVMGDSNDNLVGVDTSWVWALRRAQPGIGAGLGRPDTGRFRIVQDRATGLGRKVVLGLSAIGLRVRHCQGSRVIAPFAWQRSCHTILPP